MYIQDEPTKPLVEETDDQPKQRKTYPQNWQAYNQAQINEKWRFIELLYELCEGIDEKTFFI